ncbi:MAG: hypothetical protein AUH37_00340 [Candidatus Nitrososphaera sp. 13_1_40CM_48_12]|nr:MAG: hypothetical protein AUH37_00340 [Candidatus Nitrososphaera sp. 13_1_40CM_48_12]
MLPTGKIEELLWVLEEKVSESVLDLQITGADSNLSVKEVIRKLRVGELKMDDLSADDRLW